MLHPDVERAALVGIAMYPASRGLRKSACFKGATDKATCDLDQLERWQHEYRNPNWRMVFGPSQCWGLDLDVPGENHSDDGVAAFANLVKANGPIPAGPRTRSGGGGIGLIFKHRGEPIIGKTGTPAPGIDPRRGRLSMTIPPSIHHATRKPYYWLAAPWDVNPPVAPDWLLSLVRPPPEPARKAVPQLYDDSRARRALIRAVDAIRTAPSGASNDTLNARAFYVARVVAAGLLSESEAIDALYAAALDRRIPRMEARDTLKSAFRSGWAKPLERVA